MKTKLLITLLLTFGILAACAEMNPHPMDMSQAVQNAESKADHERWRNTMRKLRKKCRLRLMSIRNFLANMSQKAISTAGRRKILKRIAKG